MEALFFKLLSMSIPASILIGVVVLLRVLLRKSPKWVYCILWGLVAVRLVCPLSIESKFSLVPNADTVNTRLTGEQVLIQPDATYTAQPESNDATKPKQQAQPEADKKEKTEQWDALSVISWVWLAGCITMVSYAFISWFKVRRSVKLSVCTQENIYICDRIRSPFILGVIRPRIYLPSNMSEVQKENVIAHEKAHIKRLDYLWKPFGFFLLIVYWFNPLCWLAYILLCRDIELACDEKVIRDMDVNQKKIYSEVLLSFSTSEKVITACPLAFGEVGARQRIKAVLSYKKPGFWIIVAAVVLIVVTSVLFLTNPKRVDHLNEVPVDSTVYSVQADITHDGTDETIEVDVTKILSDNQMPAYVKVYDSNNQIIWQQELYLPHAGWGSYYLVEQEKKAYLLFYLPEVAQGLGVYSYRLFSLDEQGAELEAASNEITFDTYPYAEDIHFPKEEMKAFAQEINQYLQNGFLLVSTVGGALRYSTPENRTTDLEQYISLLESEGLSVTDSVWDNLEVFEEYLHELKANVFGAGNESLGESAGTEEPAMDKNEFVRTWAEAFCGRDGETIVSMSSDYVKEILEEEGLLIQGDDYVSFGWSSPWPMWEERSDYTCIYQDDEKTKAEILYYAWMSEPHVTVWKEYITFEEAGDSFVVTGEELKMYDSIVEAADFDEAYPVIDGTLMDYTKNEFGEVLGRNIMRDNTDLLKELQNPCNAARYFLNLNENLNIWVRVNNDEKSGYSLNDTDDFAGQNEVVLCIEFDGGENIRTITMIKLDDTSGIWVPQDYGEDVIDSAYEDGI